MGNLIISLTGYSILITYLYLKSLLTRNKFNELPNFKHTPERPKTLCYQPNKDNTTTPPGYESKILEIKLYWDKQQTDLSTCSMCRNEIYTDMYVLKSHQNNKINITNIVGVLCEPCYNLMNNDNGNI